MALLAGTLALFIATSYVPPPEITMALRVAADLQTPVRLNGIQPPMVFAAQVMAGVYEKLGGYDAIVTSATDGTHGKGSLHYAGLALDFRTRNVPANLRTQLFHDARAALGDEFDVVLHDTHLHVEYDPRRAAP